MKTITTTRAELIVDVIENLGLQAEFNEFCINERDKTFTDILDTFYTITVYDNLAEDELKILALAEFLEESYADAEGKMDDYLVLTDEEADEAWEESLDNYIEECVLPELPESMQRYFDSESWKSDAKYDGRGHSLSSYDGCENEHTIFENTFYIYRMN